MSVEKSIVCDGCGTILAAAKTAKEARRVAREAWDAIQIGANDYCLNCAENARNVAALRASGGSQKDG